MLVPIGVAANLCDINVGVLATQERLGGASCDATAETIATPGNGGGGGGPVNQEGLVNVNVSDVEVLVPIGIAANVCDANVGILAEQVRQGGAECTADATSIASPGSGGGGA